MIPALPFDVQRLIILQAAASLNYVPQNIYTSRSRARHLVSLALVNRDWRDVIYPILYASINYDYDEKAGVNKLSRTLADSPQLGQLITSLRVEGWNFHDFALVPNLRHFESLGNVFSEDETVEPLDAKIKLRTLKVSHIWQGNWACPCDGRECTAADDFEQCVDPTELHTLVVDLSRADPFYDIPAFVILPTVPLPYLTTVILFHTLTFNNEHGPLPHLYRFLERVGPTLLHLSLHEVSESDARPPGSVTPYELFAAVPNLLSLTISGGSVSADDFEEGHPKLEEIIIGGQNEPFTPEGISEEEKQEPGQMSGEEAMAVEMILVGVKAGGGREAYPRMKTILMRDVVFDSEDDTCVEEGSEGEMFYEGTLGELSRKVQEMGWELRDATGRNWEEAGGA